MLLSNEDSLSSKQNTVWVYNLVALQNCTVRCFQTTTYSTYSSFHLFFKIQSHFLCPIKLFSHLLLVLTIAIESLRRTPRIEKLGKQT